MKCDSSIVRPRCDLPGSEPVTTRACVTSRPLEARWVCRWAPAAIGGNAVMTGVLGVVAVGSSRCGHAS